MQPLFDHALYLLAWVSFGAGHSLLALPAFQSWLGAWTRLAYNLIATVHLLAVLALGYALLGDGAVFDRPAWLVILQWIMAAVGLAVFLKGLSAYDLGRFAGTAPIRAERSKTPLPSTEPLVTRGLNRRVRHPLYAGALLVLWGRVVDELSLATALWATSYLLIGMTLEERKLVALYGDAYRAYQTEVPALIPRWRRGRGRTARG